MAIHIGRRELIVAIGGAAVWPLAARAQQPERMRRVGVIMSIGEDAEGQRRIAALTQGLQQLGWSAGRNVSIEVRCSPPLTGVLRGVAVSATPATPPFQSAKLVRRGQNHRVSHCRTECDTHATPREQGSKGN
jgi:hypothetical protein